MIININSGSSGWGNYVINGTKKKPRDKSKVELLDGDISLGDYYSKNNKYEDSYYTVVLGFKGKPSKEVIEGAYNDFKEHFFKGFKEDEYHIDAVIHYDTDDTHIHARIPKQNLLTNTHLQLYYHKIDKPRKELIQDYISLKYGFDIARETNREIVKEQSHEHITKWREERGQEPFNFSNKKNKDKAQSEINKYISGLITSNLIEKRKDITTVLEELGLEVVKDNGLDLKKDFAYITVQNETGKMRVKGEFYHDRFWEHSTEDRRTQIESNQRIKQDTETIQERFTRVQRELRKANEKRYNKVTEHFRASRARANKQIEETTSKAIADNRRAVRRKLEHNRELIQSTNNQNISNSSNIRNNTRSNINDNDKTSSNREQNRTVTDVASAERLSTLCKRREVHSSATRENIYRTRGQNLHQDRGLDDTYRTTTHERTREVRRKRAETLREARRTRIELYKTITELRESTIRNSTELSIKHEKNANRIRTTTQRVTEQQQENIRQSEHHISTTQSIANKIEAITRFKQRISSYIKVAREYIINRYNDYVKIVNEMKYNIEGTQEHFDVTYEKEELSFADLDKTERRSS